MICPSCGEENRPNALFCMGCGTRMPEAPPARSSVEEGEKTAESVSMGYVFGTRDEDAAELNMPPSMDAGPAPAADSREGATDDAASRPGEALEAERAAGGLAGLEGAREEGGVKPEDLLPPEVDYEAPEPQAEAVVSPGEPPFTAAVTSPGQEETQAISPVIPAAGAAAAAAARPRKVICPECYAPNTQKNLYCQECGSALPTTSPRQASANRPPSGPAGQQQTAVMPAEQLVAAELPAYAAAQPRKTKNRTARSFGVADILVLASAAAVAVALTPIFTWKKGSEMGIFSHQGAFSPGRSDLLGGPGILPYEGIEFLTIGLVAAVGIGIALVFLLLRTGRGPMYILAGSVLLFPLIYIFFQGILPLRQMGMDIEPALGLKAIFTGGAGSAGLGLPIWLISGAGLLLILSGFLAPPRGWGRIFTLLLFFSLIAGAAFFCAACYNWNLFIDQPALALLGTPLTVPPLLL